MRKSNFFLAMFLSVAAAVSSPAQSVTTELDATGGYSTDDQTWVGSSQVRTFGEIKPRIQFNIEATWAKRSTDTTDAFNAAYPYDGRVKISEAYAERKLQSDSFVASVRGGQYRTPFGIHSRADYGYSGFLRAPLIRAEYNWSINNTMMERGATFMAGTPHFSGEISVGTPGDLSDNLERRRGLGTVIRLQAYVKGFVIGASHIDSPSYAPASNATPGKMVFSGADLRWSYGGVQVRSEWLTGRQWNDGTRTWGGYVDAIVHRPSMGRVTAVFRTERLDFIYPYAPIPDGPMQNNEWRAFRQTAGGRIRIPGGLTAQVNVFRHSKWVAYDGQTAAFDFALTYSLRASSSKNKN